MKKLTKKQRDDKKKSSKIKEEYHKCREYVDRLLNKLILIQIHDDMYKCIITKYEIREPLDGSRRLQLWGYFVGNDYKEHQYCSHMEIDETDFKLTSEHSKTDELIFRIKNGV